MAELGGTFQGRVVLDAAALQAFYNSPQGPIVDWLMVQGEAVKRAAQASVGVYRIPQGDPRPRRRRPGTLRDSIVKRLVSEGGLPQVLVGTEDPVGLWHHEGTVPHRIEPRRRGGVLVFYSGGQKQVRRSVRHPGTQPNRFLTVAGLGALGPVRRQEGGQGAA